MIPELHMFYTQYTLGIDVTYHFWTIDSFKTFMNVIRSRGIEAQHR